MQLLELYQIPGFMPKYGSDENQPVSRKPLSVERKQAQFQPHRRIKCTYATSVNLFQKKKKKGKYANFDNHAVSWKWLPNLKLLWFFNSFTPKTGMQILNLPANSVF